MANSPDYSAWFAAHPDFSMNQYGVAVQNPSKATTSGNLSYTPSSSYNYNPSPQSGSGVFGSVPGVIELPNPSADLTRQIPNLGSINSSIFGNLYDESRGVIPQADQNFMQDQAAARAAGAGMPGTNIMPGTLEGNSAARNLGLLSYQLQQQAAQSYPGLVGAVSSTQTVSPALQTSIAEQNAANAAAPNPTAANSYAQQLYDQYLKAARGPGGGTGGGWGPARGTRTGTETGASDSSPNYYDVYDPAWAIANEGEAEEQRRAAQWKAANVSPDSTPGQINWANYEQTTADFNDLFGGDGGLEMSPEDFYDYIG